MRIARRSVAGALLAAAWAVSVAAPARADSGKLPQMDFQNPLTLSQVGWMAVILIALYLVLAYWGLPRIGSVIAFRTSRIRSDLDAARLARSESERAIRELDRAIRDAREESDRTVQSAIDNARARARADEQVLAAKLQADLSRAETQIADARARAMAALLPIAEDVAHGLVERISGQAPERARLNRTLATIQTG